MRKSNLSGMRSSNIKKNIRSNLRSNMKSEVVKQHFTDIKQDNDDLMGSLLKMDDPDFGREEKKPKKTEPKTFSKPEEKKSVRKNDQNKL